MFPKHLFTCILLLSVGGTLAADLPIVTLDGVAIIQNANGDNDTRIYIQPPAGTITEISTNGTFDTGSIKGTGPLDIVPASEALLGTLISAVVLGDYEEVHVFFLSPTRILSEYLWTLATSWIGGSRCPQCVTTQGLRVASNHNALSATVNPVTGILAVGFMASQGPDVPENPKRLVEAVRAADGWIVSGLQGTN